MNELEKSFIREALKPVNLRIIYGVALTIITGTVGVTMAYNGIVNEIRADKVDGKHKDELQDRDIAQIEVKLSDKAWRSEVDNLMERVIQNEKVNETLRK